MGKTALMFLVMLSLSAIVIYGQGQTDKSKESDTSANDIHDYDITVNSLDNGHYKIGIKNNLQLSELDVFFDEKPMGSIPKGPAWKEFDVEALPLNVKVSGDGKDWHKDLRDYVPLAFEKGYGVIDENLNAFYKGTKDPYDLGLKVKIEYPLDVQVSKSEEIVVELITLDAKAATTPDLGHNIGSGDIKIACDKSIFKEEGMRLWIDPVRITDDGMMKPYNEYYNYQDLFNINKRDSLVLETEAKILSVLPLVDWYVASQDVSKFRPEAMGREDIFLCGDVPQSNLFYDDNKYILRTYGWNLDFFKTFTNSANRVKLRFPFYLENLKESSFAIYIAGEYNQNPLQDRGIFAYEMVLSPQSTELPTKETEVLFPDPNLEAAIRAAINKPKDQPLEEYWTKTFGGSHDDEGHSVQQTNDGGYIIVGMTKFSETSGEDIWLIKTDANGNEIWNKTYEKGGPYFRYSVLQTNDGGYIISGGPYSSVGGREFTLIKTDANGNKLWDKALGGSNAWGYSGYGYSVQQTNDGGYIITGRINSGIIGQVWLIKTDANGNKLWEKIFGGSEGESWGYSVEQTTDGGYIIAGITDTSLEQGRDVLLMKTDANGNKLWEKTFGGSGFDDGYSVQETTDGGYIITGKKQIDDYHLMGQSDDDVLLIKTDANGNELWEKTFGGSHDDEGYSVQETNDGGYIVAGRTDTWTEQDDDVLLIKTDANGNELWEKTFGGSRDDEGYSVQQTDDGGYIITGTTYSYGAGGSDVWLIKTDKDGNEMISE
jgi:hypothetical protein